MSTKSTILNTPACHIYHDYAYQHTEKTDIDGQKEVLVIEVSYGFIDFDKYEDQSVMVVEWDSDFAKMVRLMIDKCGASWIESMHRVEEKVDLRFCLNYVHFSKDKENTGEVKRIGSMHPQLAMKELGISYERSIPQSIADQWWFLGCKASPEKLPPFLSVIEGGVSSHWK